MSTRTKRRRARGFTLVELLVVMVIIGMIMDPYGAVILVNATIAHLMSSTMKTALQLALSSASVTGRRP